MTIPIIRSRAFEQDLDAFVGYFLDQHAYHAARDFGAAVDATLAFIAEFPDLGESRSNIRRSWGDLRVLPTKDFPRHLIWFVRSAHRIDVVRLLHGSRRVHASDFPESSK